MQISWDLSCERKSMGDFLLLCSCWKLEAERRKRCIVFDILIGNYWFCSNFSNYFKKNKSQEKCWSENRYTNMHRYSKKQLTIRKGRCLHDRAENSVNVCGVQLECWLASFGQRKKAPKEGKKEEILFPPLVWARRFVGCGRALCVIFLFLLYSRRRTWRRMALRSSTNAFESENVNRTDNRFFCRTPYVS